MQKSQTKRKLMLQLKNTLNNKARCLHKPMERFPIGTTTDPKQSFRSLLHSLQNEPNSSSEMGEPLDKKQILN